MSEFKLPNPKDKSGKILGFGLLGIAGLAFYSYILPWLLTVVWGTVELITAGAILTVLLMIVSSKKFWKRLSIILSALGELAFGWFVEMNPWAILDAQLSSAEDDREKLKIECQRLKAQDDKLTTQLKDENDNMVVASKKIELCKRKLSQNPADEEVGYQLEAATNDFSNSKDFIDSVSPIATDIRRLVAQADKAYMKSGFALENSRNKLRKQRAAYDAVTTGSNAMKRALRAFTGDSEMNKAADIALNKLKTEISEKIGVIKDSIQATSRLMNEKDLNDAAKVSLAAEQIDQLNIDAKFDYVAQVGDLGAKLPTPVRAKWLE